MADWYDNDWLLPTPWEVRDVESALGHNEFFDGLAQEEGMVVCGLAQAEEQDMVCMSRMNKWGLDISLIGGGMVAGALLTIGLLAFSGKLDA